MAFVARLIFILVSNVILSSFCHVTFLSAWCWNSEMYTFNLNELDLYYRTLFNVYDVDNVVPVFKRTTVSV